MSIFKEFVKRMEEYRISTPNEPDPICECYAKKPNDCFHWDYCTQRIEYKNTVKLPEKLNRIKYEG